MEAHAALLVRRMKGVGTLRGVRAAAKNDGGFTMIGYPWYRQGGQEYWQGEYKGHMQWNTALIRGRPHLLSGYSGGATLNRYGEYVGPCNGYTNYGNGMPSYAASGPALIQFVGRYMDVEQ
jgi:hypothetical protein